VGIVINRIALRWVSHKELYTPSTEVPTPPGKSSIFFLENSRTWKVLENHFGSGKSWKLKLKVMESPGKYP